MNRVPFPLLVLFVVLYVLSPIDCLPDVFPIVGWLDDVGLLGYLGYSFVALKKEPQE